jgi:hypothetical protein
VETLEAREVPSFAFRTIDVPGATSTSLLGISASGEIVGRYTADGITHGFLLSGGSYTTLDVPGATETWAINASGQIVGNFIADGTTHGFLRSGGTYTTLDPPGSTSTMPRGINDTGQTVGGYEDSDGTLYGFLLSGGVFTTIDVPGAAFTSYASGINDLGQIVGRFDTADSNFGFLLDGGTYTTLDVPGSVSSAALGILNSGRIVGGYTAGGTRRGYLLSEDTYTLSEVPGSTLTTPFKINDAGLIAGFYVAGGTNHGFLGTFEPPAQVASVVVNDGSAQRSMVIGLTVTFGAVVTLDPGACELRRQDGNPVGLSVATSVVDGRTIAPLTFTGPDVTGGPPAHGNYARAIRGGQVHDAIGRPLDGAGDGTPGGRRDALFGLYGDSDGARGLDGRLGLIDLPALAARSGTHWNP